MTSTAQKSFWAGIVLSLGLLAWGVLIVFNWLMRDYDRYLWVIHGPFPFSHFGSGPLQLWMHIFLGGFGLTCILIALSLREKNKNNKQ